MYPPNNICLELRFLAKKIHFMDEKHKFFLIPDSISMMIIQEEVIERSDDV